MTTLFCAHVSGRCPVDAQFCLNRKANKAESCCKCKGPKVIESIQEDTRSRTRMGVKVPCSVEGCKNNAQENGECYEHVLAHRRERGVCGYDGKEISRHTCYFRHKGIGHYADNPKFAHCLECRGRNWKAVGE